MYYFCGKIFIIFLNVNGMIKEQKRLLDSSELKKKLMELENMSKEELKAYAEKLERKLFGDPIPEGEFLTITQVGKLLNISRSTIFRYRKEGILNTHKIGNKTLFARAEIDKLMRKEANDAEC